jgi:ABC-2 type transport system ATP-binding protein
VGKGGFLLPIAAVETEQLGRIFRERGGIFQRAAGEPREALREVTLRVEPGECLALVGPNGAGKSTLLRVLATLVAPSSGMARVAGYDVVRESRAVRRSVGVMNSDDRSFFWPLSGVENLRFFARMQGMPVDLAQRRAAEVLEQVGLSGAAEQRVSGYSSGMRQRLNIARALLHAPPVLLLDEPTANLDLEHRAQVIDAVRELLRGERAVLVATHDAGLVVALADNVARLEEGRLVAMRQRRDAVRYRLLVGGLALQLVGLLGTAQPAANGVELDVEDLGDGYALAAAISAIVGQGGEVLAVEVHRALEPSR